MKKDFILYLVDVLMNQADAAAFILRDYEDDKDPKYLKYAADGIRLFTHQSLTLYGLARDCQEYLNLKFDELTERVSSSCENGAFLRQTDVSAWNGLSDCKPSDISWDEFYEKIRSYAKKVQNFYNNEVVPHINCDSDDEFYSTWPRRRVSNFN